MIVNVRGVVLDGTLFSPGVPTDRRQPIDLFHRNDVQVVCRLFNPSGAVIRVSGVSAARLTVQELRAGAGALLTKAGVLDAGANTITFTFADTEITDTKIPAGTYVYEVMVTLGSGLREVVIPMSALRIYRGLSAA